MVYFYFERYVVMHYVSNVLQSEALFQLQENLENSKLHVKRVISPNDVK